jgi:hypothetical protein
MYKKYVDELPALNLNIEEHNKLKNDYSLLETQVQAVLEEQEKRHLEALNNLNLQHESIVGSLNLQHENIVGSLKIQLQEAINSNYENVEKLKILQSNVNDSTNFIRDQNETLLQEIKRLKAEMAEMSNK